MSPGFRLLAITPPTGAVDPALVTAWGSAWSGPTAVGLAVLLREPGTAPAELVAPSHRLAPLRRACARVGVPWVLSVDRAQLAALDGLRRMPGWAGVQLRGDPGLDPVRAARARLGEGMVIGRSCHGTPASMGDEVDYSVLAPIFTPQTASAPVGMGGAMGTGKRGVGLEPLRAFTARQAHVFALGGITPSRAAACVRAGAFGLAAIGSFFGPVDRVADDVARLVRALTEPAPAPPDDAASPP